MLRARHGPALCVRYLGSLSERAVDGKHNVSTFSDSPEVTSKWQDGDPTPRPWDSKFRLPAWSVSCLEHLAHGGCPLLSVSHKSRGPCTSQGALLGAQPSLASCLSPASPSSLCLPISGMTTAGPGPGHKSRPGFSSEARVEQGEPRMGTASASLPTNGDI